MGKLTLHLHTLVVKPKVELLLVLLLVGSGTSALFLFVEVSYNSHFCKQIVLKFGKKKSIRGKNSRIYGMIHRLAI